MEDLKGFYLVTAAYDTLIQVTDLFPSNDEHPTKYQLAKTQANKMIHLDGPKFLVACNPYIFIYERVQRPSATAYSSKFKFVGHQSNVTDMALSEDKQFLYTCSEDKTWKRYKLCEFQAEFSVSTSSSLNTLTLITGTPFLVTGNDRGQLELWNTEDRSLVNTFKVGTSIVRSLAYSETHQKLIVGSQNGTVTLVSIVDGQFNMDGSVEAHSAILTRVTVSNNGDLFATASSDSTAKVFSVADLTQIAHLRDAQMVKWVWDVKFSRDDKYLFTGGTDCIARLWDIQSASILKVYRSHQRGITSIAVIN